MNPNVHIQSFQSTLHAQYVKNINVYHFEDNTPIQLHPEGRFDMVFQLNDDVLHNTSTTNGWERRPHNFVGGFHDKSYWIRPTKKNTKLYNVQFYSNSARHFLPGSLKEYKNQIVDLYDVFNARKLQKLVALNDGETDNHKTQIELLLSELFKEKTISAIDFCSAKIEKAFGRLKISDLAKSIGFSDAQFRKRFGEEIGMSPKEYSKIIRVKSIIQVLKNNSDVSLTDVAYMYGYYDQAHFIKEFKSVVGQSPKKILRSS